LTDSIMGLVNGWFDAWLAATRRRRIFALFLAK
jgi:hypothetical protein